VHERRSHLILVGLIVAALIGVALLAVPGSPVHKKPTLGLDLQGGLEVILKAVPPKGHTLTQDDLDRSVSIMRNRIDKLGVSEPEIRKQGNNQIVIELAGVHDPAAAARLIGKTAQLEFYDLENDLTGPSISIQGNPVPTTSLYDLLSKVQAQAKTGTPAQWYLFDGKKNVVAGPLPTKERLLKKHGGVVPEGYKAFAVPENTVVLSCGPNAVVCPGTNGPPPSNVYYLFKHQIGKVPELTGNDLKLSGTRADIDPNTGQPIVLMQFTGKGGKQFHAITREEAFRGKLRQTPQHFAIVLDNQIQSFPQIDYTQYPDGIDPINGAQITGLKDATEAKDIALVLQTGALPVNFTPIERTDVSATLGKDSLHQALRAAIAGLIVVAIFLLVLYRFLGLVAVIGLGIYGALLYAALLLLNVTLTLPGFAGLVLTIGVAADANVVVFERIKEEVRAGKSVRAAISAGYSKGFHTIIDANVVTAITALVLFAVATAGVKGFALMLLIGTVISLLTAVLATRALLGLLAGFRWFSNPRFMGAQGAQTAKWLQIDFIGKRRLWFAISGVVILIGLVSLGVRGLNFGIDFKGGTQISFATPAPQTIQSVRSQFDKIGRGGEAVIQGRGRQIGGGYENFQVRTKALTVSKTQDQTSEIQNLLKTNLGAQRLGVTTVSSSFGHQIARLAVIAVIVSLLLIIIYIAIRFDFKFAVPVIVALLHDILITVGVYSLTGFEVTTSTVAAVLTVLGYSIYDTIIIFDRIRENVPIMRRSPYATIVNTSLWETIRRSLATTFITLLPIIMLLLFGGATLKDFAFAILIGVTSGAYSSIFIAAPLLAMWKEREPEYARRRHIAEAGGDGAVPEQLLVKERAGTEPVPFEPDEDAAPTPTPAGPVPAATGPAAPTPAAGGDPSKRERRRQRRQSRPHGRPR
jgi:SecD/SecF fusion protein